MYLLALIGLILIKKGYYFVYRLPGPFVYLSMYCWGIHITIEVKIRPQYAYELVNC